MIVSVMNLKGGTGKTTSAIALATAATRKGLTARVLDTDAQSSASMWSMLAADADDPLPFDVLPGNIATVKGLARRLKGDPDEWVIIDCPPSGAVLDEAVGASDLVVVATTPHPADMAKTMEAVATLRKSDVFYVVLVLAVRSRTNAFATCMSDLADRNVSYFDTTIPQREDVSNFFGNSFGADLYGYERVLDEMMEVLDDAS